MIKGWCLATIYITHKNRELITFTLSQTNITECCLKIRTVDELTDDSVGSKSYYHKHNKHFLCFET